MGPGWRIWLKPCESCEYRLHVLERLCCKSAASLVFPQLQNDLARLPCKFVIGGLGLGPGDEICEMVSHPSSDDVASVEGVGEGLAESMTGSLSLVMDVSFEVNEEYFVYGSRYGSRSSSFRPMP